MVLGNKPKPAGLVARCAAAFALSVALPVFADTEERDDNTQPGAIAFFNPSTPDPPPGQGEARNDSRTITKPNGNTEFRQRTRIRGNPVGQPSLAIYNFFSDDNIVTRSNSSVFKFTERTRVQ